MALCLQPLPEWETLPDMLPFLDPQIFGIYYIYTNELEYQERRRMFILWVACQRYWYYCLSTTIFPDSNYDFIKRAMLRWEQEDENLTPMPLRYWNHLPDRYPAYVQQLFSAYPLKPRYPWLHGEGVYQGRIFQPTVTVPRRATLLKKDRS